MQATPFDQRTAEQHAIIETWDMLLDDQESYQSYRGTFAVTKALRSLAAIHGAATRQAFIGAMLAVPGMNETTLRIQFNQSRRNSVEWFGDCTMLADGSLADGHGPLALAVA